MKGLGVGGPLSELDLLQETSPPHPIGVWNERLRRVLHYTHNASAHLTVTGYEVF